MHETLRVNIQLQGKPEGVKGVRNKDHLAQEAIGNKCACFVGASSNQ